jgi:TatD DNase family protein
VNIIDAHIHLEQYPADELDGWIESWQAQGVSQVIAVSTDLRSSYRTLELAQRHPSFVRPALGWHPEQALPSSAELAELIALIRSAASSRRIAAIGEVGLPHYSLTGTEDDLPRMSGSLELLSEFAALSDQTGLPLSLHAVHDKVAPVLSLLERTGVTRAHFHWLKASSADIARIVRGGYYVSVTPELIYRERDRQLLLQLPLSLLLLETDGPWPYEGPFRGIRTTPLLIRDTARVAARLTNRTEAELLEICRSNAGKLYGS